MKTLSALFSVATLLSMAGGTTTLVSDDTRQPAAADSQCAGSEWVDDSSVAVLPIPVVAFFAPHADIHDIRADNYLKRQAVAARRISDRGVADDQDAPLGPVEGDFVRRLARHLDDRQRPDFIADPQLVVDARAAAAHVLGVVAAP